MRKEIAEKWVAALLSREYEQERGYLHTEHGHCCLGVLCDLHLRETGRGEWRPPGSGDSPHSRCYRDGLGIDGEYTPPPGVLEWAGMAADPQLFFRHRLGNEMRDEIVNLNDGGYSFRELAELIEWQWESL
jgi:hypothetical protein